MAERRTTLDTLSAAERIDQLARGEVRDLTHHASSAHRRKARNRV